MLRSVLDLIDDGELNPKMHQVVERSGTPERTIFRYFTDVGDLTMRAVDLALADIADDIRIEDLGEGPVERRIDDYVRTRLRVLARVHQLGRVARLRVTISPEMDDTIRRLILIQRDQIAQQFAPELDRMEARDGDDALDTITVLTSFESYDVSRRQLGATDDDVARCWTAAIARLLG